jgi:hypothetical protein
MQLGFVAVVYFRAKTLSCDRSLGHVDPITMRSRRPKRSACKISQFRRSAVPVRIGRGARMGQGAISSAFPSAVDRRIC